MIWIDRDDGNGFYLCEKWERCSPHMDCATPISVDIYKEMKRGAEAEVDHNITAPDVYTNPSNFAKVLKVSLFSAVLRKAFKPPVRRAPVTPQPRGVHPPVLSHTGESDMPEEEEAQRQRIITGKRTGEEVETGGQSEVKKPIGRSRKEPAGVTGEMGGATAAAVAATDIAPAPRATPPAVNPAAPVPSSEVQAAAAAILAVGPPAAEPPPGAAAGGVAGVAAAAARTAADAAPTTPAARTAQILDTMQLTRDPGDPRVRWYPCRNPLVHPSFCLFVFRPSNYLTASHRCMQS